MKKEYISPLFEYLRVELLEEVLSSSVESYSSIIDDGDWGDDDWSDSDGWTDDGLEW